jgi:hypothetical protein
MEDLIAMGFDVTVAQNALNAAGGDKSLAIEILLRGDEEVLYTLHQDL